MIDLHCHLIPGIDDGPRDMEAALELARLSAEDGVRKAVCTPHIRLGMFDNNVSSITGACAAFSKAVKRAGIPLEVRMGAEVHICPEIMMMVERNLIPYIGEWEGRKVMLLEFPHGHLLPGSDKLVGWLLKRGVIPMIAHPERNKSITNDPDRLAPFIDMGCLVQVTAGSLAGGFGDQVKAAAEAVVSRGWVTVLASDAHNAARRPPGLSRGREAAAALLGEEAAWKLVRENPAKIAGAPQPVAA